jgi:hypothetical protein
MQNYIFLIIGILCATVYWSAYHLFKFSEKKLCKLKKTGFSFIKWCSISTLIYYTGWNIESLTLLLYSIGDVAIMYEEIYGVIAFLAGHLSFIFIIIVEHDWQIFSMSFALASPIYYLLLRKSLRQKQIICKILYFMYVQALAYVLVHTIFQYNFGYLLFALSDISIGFKSKHGRLAEFPLYYISIILFIREFIPLNFI